jgi:hypothetical protein
MKSGSYSFPIAKFLFSIVLSIFSMYSSEPWQTYMWLPAYPFPPSSTDFSITDDNCIWCRKKTRYEDHAFRILMILAPFSIFRQHYRDDRCTKLCDSTNISVIPYILKLFCMVSSELLWIRQWTIGLHKRQRIYWLAERLLGCKVGLFFWVSC